VQYTVAKLHDQSKAANQSGWKEISVYVATQIRWRQTRVFDRKLESR